MNAGNVFRAYDIRGVVDRDFNAEWVTHLGKACGTYLAGRGISSAVIGYDCRHSSPAYHDALVEGILSTGTDVISIGMVPTPALYFAVKHLNRQGGVMITARHNSESGEKDDKGNYVRRERKFGSFSRSFDVSGIDTTAIKAAYNNGILELTLPKKGEVTPASRSIQIEG